MTIIEMSDHHPSTHEPTGGTPADPTLVSVPDVPTFDVVAVDGTVRTYTAEEIRERLATSHAADPIGDLRMCDVCGRGLGLSGFHTHSNAHLRLIGDLPPSAPRGPRLSRVFSADAVFDLVASAEQPMTQAEICDAMGAITDLERKAVSNRVTRLVKSRRLRGALTGVGTTRRYDVPPRRGRPTRAATAAASTTDVVVAETEPPMRPAPIDVTDACTGMLMGMTGVETVRIDQLPDLMRWVDHTRSIVSMVADHDR